MKRASLFVVCFIATVACRAGDLAPGHFSGTIAGLKAKNTATATLDIVTVDDGRVKARFALVRLTGPKLAFRCEGKYELAGTYAGNKLVLADVAGSGTGPGDCHARLDLAFDGAQLSGTYNRAYDLVLKP